MQQKNDYDCGVFACQFAYGMIRLINTNVIKQSSRIRNIKRTFEKLCSNTEKARLGRMTTQLYAKRNDFIFKVEYAQQWRTHFIKLICGLSILNKPNSAPASYVGINNPKNMCFAIASVHCFLRCTRCIQMMKEIVRTENKERNAFSKLLLDSLVEIQSAVYIKTSLCKDNSQDDEDKEDYNYIDLPLDYISNLNTDEETADITKMKECTNGEPYGKC